MLVLYKVFLHEVFLASSGHIISVHFLQKIFLTVATVFAETFVASYLASHEIKTNENRDAVLHISSKM
jgi:hypothetical protein